MTKLHYVLFLPVILLLTLNAMSGCKSRKVAIKTTDSTSILKEAEQSSIKETKIDTGKLLYTKIAGQKEFSIYNDSTNTKTTIAPIPGTPFTIYPDGTFHGQASSVVTDYKTGSNKNQKTKSSLQEKAAEFKGLSANKTVNNAYTKSDSTGLRSKDKTVDAKPNFGAWPWMIGIVIVLCFLAALWWFLGKPRGLK